MEGLELDGTIAHRQLIPPGKEAVHLSPFLEAFNTLYGYHTEYLSLHTFEAGYCPMFINKKGMAMPYGDYYKRFGELVDGKLRSLLLEHADPECRIYGQLLCENRLGPHALRHWFSVQLALRGEDVAQLQFWRGDKNPQSAFDYPKIRATWSGSWRKRMS